MHISLFYTGRSKFPHGFSCLASVLRPKSRGTIRLASVDPRVMPLIDPSYLEHPGNLSYVFMSIFIQACIKIFKPEPTALAQSMMDIYGPLRES